jgi:putative transposase
VEINCESKDRKQNMSAFNKLAYHIIFSTKFRRPLIETEIQKRLYEYIGGIIRTQNGHIIEIGGIEDHIHILANLSPKIAICDAIREIKSNSSKWCNTLPGQKGRFEWQKGYGIFSVSYSLVDSVAHYIQNQREHHQTKPFEEEYIKFLELHDLAFDRKFLFEAEHHG